LAKREFRLEKEYHYNRSRPVRWIISHMMRYPVFPLAVIVTAVLNNWSYSRLAERRVAGDCAGDDGLGRCTRRDGRDT